jgi:hypothetical protein
MLANSFIMNNIFTKGVVGLFKIGKSMVSYMTLMRTTVIPAILSVASAILMTVMPIVIIIMGIILLALFVLHAMKVGFWQALKDVGDIIWPFITDKLFPFIKNHPVLASILGAVTAVVAWFAGAMTLKGIVNIISGIIKTVNVVVKIIQGIAWFVKFGIKALKAAWWATEKIWHGAKWLAAKGFSIISQAAKFIPMIFAWLAGPGLTTLIGILASIPVIGWIILGIGSLIAFVWFFKDEIWAFIKPVVMWLWEGLKVAWEFIYPILKTVTEWIWAVLKIQWDVAMVILSWVGEVFKGAWELMYPLLKTVVDWVWGGLKIQWDIAMGILSWVGGVFKTTWDTFSNAFTTFTEWLSGFLTGFGDVLWDKVKSGFTGIKDALNPFNWFAEGAIVTGPTRAVIGEAGPEAVVPLKGQGTNTLTGLLNTFFDTYLPFLKPAVEFIWSVMRPVLSFMKGLIEIIYSGVYNVISGLSGIPSWLGGSIFKSLLSKMETPTIGSSSAFSGSSKGEKGTYMTMLSGSIDSGTTLGLISDNQAQVSKIDANAKPVIFQSYNDLNKYVTNSTNNISTNDNVKGCLLYTSDAADDM